MLRARLCTSLSRSTRHFIRVCSTVQGLEPAPEPDCEPVLQTPVPVTTVTIAPPDESLPEVHNVTAMQLVKNFLASDGTYEEEFYTKEVEYYFKHLQLARTYFYNYGPRRIANHILSLISAKTLAEMSGNPNNVENFVEGDAHAMYWTTITPDNCRKMEQRVVDYVRNTPIDMGFSVSYFRSGGTISESIPHHLGLYSASRSKFTRKFDETMKTSNVKHVATQEFLQIKSAAVKERYQRVLDEKSTKLPPVIHEEDDPVSGSKVVVIGYNKAQRGVSFILGLCELVRTTNMVINRMFAEKFANGVQVYTFNILNHDEASLKQFKEGAATLNLLPNEQLNGMLYSGKWSTAQLLYAHSATMFAFYFLGGSHEEYTMLKQALQGKRESLEALKGLRSTMRREGMSEEQIYQVLLQYPDIVDKLFQDFKRRMAGDADAIGQPNNELLSDIMERVHSVYHMHVLRAFAKFNSSIIKTNFFKPLKSAVSYRLDPWFLKESDYPEVPYGLFMITGSDFNSFHVRFRDIARGGIRLIQPRPQEFTRRKEYLFDETYGLAYTQQQKNKDIPEGGSKGAILCSGSGGGSQIFRKYIDAFLDVLLADSQNIIDLKKQQELIFFGPDEGTADFMDWAALHSKNRGYGIWKALTTGKSISLGGIPHDTYGMTTQSVHTMVLESLNELGLDETKITKFQTGGPDGDLGSNEILISKDKTIAIVDKSGVIYDPKGLNREELTRLARARHDVSRFNKDILSKEGFKVLTTDHNITLPNGELVEDGGSFSNNFYLHPLSTADLFVPCGGRPDSINTKTLPQTFDSNGKFKWKLVVEGANLFISQQARIELETKHGVFLIRDAAANKGGVTSSSLEVLAGLTLNDDEHKQYMCASNKSDISRFYKAYVADVLKVITDNAKMEFHALSRARKETGIARAELVETISDKINYLTDNIASSDLHEDKTLFHAVMQQALPPLLLKQVPLHIILERVPLPYLRALFSSHLARLYVYRHGLKRCEFTFWEYVQGMKRA